MTPRAVLVKNLISKISLVVHNKNGPDGAGNTNRSLITTADKERVMTVDQSTQNLQSRFNLALSILDHREYSERNWELALDALKGASIEDLMDLPSGDA